MNELSMPKAIFFDWDGTLVDSFAFLHAAHNHTRQKLGFADVTIEEYHRYFGQPRDTLYNHLYEGYVEEAKQCFEDYVFKNHISGLKPIDGAEGILKLLQELDVVCGVVSNKKGNLIEAEIAHYGWGDYFQSVVGAGEAAEDKPSPEPLLLAIHKAGIDIAMRDLWFVGDTDNDLICSNTVNAITVLIRAEAESIDLLEKYEVHLHRNNCRELYEFLLQYKDNWLKK